MTEATFERHLTSALKKLGAYTKKLDPSSAKGMPDRLVIMPNSLPMLVELKWMGDYTEASLDSTKIIKTGITAKQKYELIQINHRSPYWCGRLWLGYRLKGYWCMVEAPCYATEVYLAEMLMMGAYIPDYLKGRQWPTEACEKPLEPSYDIGIAL